MAQPQRDAFHLLKELYYHHVATGPFDRVVSKVMPSDIVLHLAVLEYYASLCRHVTEFGVRDGHSTVALIAGCPGHVVSYDVVQTPIVERLAKMPLPCATWEFCRADTTDGNLQIAETDFLFIDTLHTFDQLSRELLLHGRQARKYLGFHDTFTCGTKDLSGPDPKAPGIRAAIELFVSSWPGAYRRVYETSANNGLLILERHE